MAKPFFDHNEIDEIKKVLDSGWVSQGPKVKEFEDIVAKFVGAKYAIAVSNCTAALHLANLSLGISKGDEVIVADYTFPATGHSVLYCGAKPIFVDINPKTYNIDQEKIERQITKKTKAIIPVHTFGQPAEMNRILEIAEKHGLRVIEDAACALGAKYKNKYAGTIGDIGCYSFHARKGITTGEGGMVVTNDLTFAEKIKHLSVFGMKSAWDREKSNEFIVPEFVDIGFNYKMSDILAAVGIIQFQKIEKIISKKRILAQYWNEKLEDNELIEGPYESPDNYHIYQSFVVTVDKKISRNQLIQRLHKRGIQTQIGTYASHIQPVYHYLKSCPVSFDIFSRSLALPLYYELTEGEIDLIAKSLHKEMRGLK